MGAIATTAAPLSGGVTAVTGVAKRYRVEFTGTWAVNELFRLNLVATATAKTDLAGNGTVTGLQPTFAFTFDDKVNLLAGTNWYFSEVGNPANFNNPNTLGNSFIQLSNIFGNPEDITAMAVYQGRLALIARRTTQFWSVDPDPANYQRGQVLQNIGTVAKLSVQSVGDLDVYMLADNGVRSLRVRDSSNNAIIADIGTPVDEIIRGVLEGLTEAQRAAACAVVEPSSNRYWLYLPTGHIYVFSSFPASGIAAWTRYQAITNLQDYEVLPVNVGSTHVYTTVIGRKYFWLKQTGSTSLTCGATVLTEAGYFTATATTATVIYSNAPTGEAVYDVTAAQFTPEKFVVQNGRVYARSGDNIYLYGGLNNQTYDFCAPQWDLPFLNAKTPATRKMYQGLDAICEGTWQVSLGTKVADANAVNVVYRNTGPSVDNGKSLAGKQGTHFKLRGVELSTGYARFSSAILHYEGADNK